MVGVANPMLRESRRNGAVFLAAYAAGMLISSLAVGLVAAAVGLAVAAVVPFEGRVGVTIAVFAVLAVLDASGRTPQLWRQVPQSFVRLLPPSVLGVVYGLDIGLIFTTKRTTSLVTAVVVGGALLTPGHEVLLLLAIGGAGIAAAVVPAVHPTAERLVLPESMSWGVTGSRRIAATTLVAAAVVVGSSGLWG